jgi:pre-mRNA-splicing factor 38A
MANVTDPLARSVHGTNPQNLIEYITRQKIYDSLYWKEHCFGLSAADVAVKAAKDVKAVGGSYGGNNRPTRFLCLTLKLLQIQPEEGIIESFIENEDFKYVRALGAFYLRLTGRPAEIYDQLEPLYNDFRKLRFRESMGWKLCHMDELVDELLNSDRCCGIALPHLPRRDVLVNAGYLDGPRVSTLTQLIDEKAGGNAEEFLRILAQENMTAKTALDDRIRLRVEMEEKESVILAERISSSQQRPLAATSPDNDGYVSQLSHRRNIEQNIHHDKRQHDEEYRAGLGDNYQHNNNLGNDNEGREEIMRSKNKKKSANQRGGNEKKYGSLFKQKKSDNNTSDRNADTNINDGGVNENDINDEKSDDYWNEQRAKLGLKPLKD